MTDFTNGEFNENIARVENLISASKRLVGEDISDTQLANEVLRAAVVFLHSSLEEIIRNLFLHKLPQVTPENLNKVPFNGHEPTHRPKGILLGDLLEYRGQFVENLIRDSIDQYVNTININGTNQLVDCLKLADVPHEPLRPFFEPLDTLMKRRHIVVHQMDRSSKLDPLTSNLNDIDEAVVVAWKIAIVGFATQLFATVP
jgi:hypothetical protein